MPLTDPQSKIFSDQNRFRCVAAGRRFGKTYLSLWEIARVARLPGQKVYYIAPTYRMAKQILWDEIKEQMLARRWVKKVNESDLSLRLKNGSVISLRSADNPDSMRGVALDFAVLDEAAYMDRETWTHVIRPTLSDRNGGALFISTPRGYDWFHELWTGAHSQQDYSAYQFTTIEGGNVTPAEVESAKSELDEMTFRQEYEASFENASHSIYHAFNMSNVVQYKDEIPKHVMVGIDFNVDPCTAIVCAKVDQTLHVIDEIILPNSNTAELATEIVTRYRNHRITAFPDAAGRQRRSSAGGKTDILILEEAGIPTRAPRTNPAVIDRINTVNRLLCDANGERRLFVDPSCKRVIEMFQKMEYKAGTRIPDKNSGYDHSADALGYAVMGTFPIRRPMPEARGPDMFTHM